MGASTVPERMLACQVVEVGKVERSTLMDRLAAPTSCFIPGSYTNNLLTRWSQYKKPYAVQEVDAPKEADLEPNDILVKLAVSSLCHTDGMVSNGDFQTKLPCIASHEGAGTVVAVGSGVTDFKVGTRVMCGIIFHACGHCAECRNPDSQYCQNVQYIGRYIAVSLSQIVPGTSPVRREICSIVHR